jgi:hypothetical protein
MGWKTTLGAALLSVTCAQAWATTVTVNATPAPVAPGSSVSVAVNVADVANLAGYGFSLTYNASLLHFTGFTGGAFLGSGGANTDQGVVDVNDAAGMIGYAYGVTDVGGVSGAGTLGWFNFEALAAGTSVINLADVLLVSSINDADGFGLTIPTTVTNGSVTVQAPVTPPPAGDVPEPASWMLMGVGLVAAGTLRRRRVGGMAAHA